jgi:peptidoglycan/LPS O-acetylase OafA/YrhL
MSGAPGDGRLETLDALRGVAAIAVFAFHLRQLTFGYDVVFPNGGLAVDFFFVLSGYVIGRAYERKLRGQMSVQAFAWRRLLRVYPAAFAGLVIGLLVTLPGHGLAPFAPALLLNFLLLPVFGRAMGLFPLNGPLWSLFFELAANLAHALVLPKLTTARLALGVGALGVGLLAVGQRRGTIFVGWRADGITDAAFLYGFVRVGFCYGAGLLLYRLVENGRLKPPAVPPLVPILLLAGVLAVPTLDRLLLLQELAAVFVVFPALVLLGANPVRRSNPASRWLGGISYPLYALHGPLLLVMMVVGKVPAPNAAILGAVSFVAILGAATAFWRYCEQPLLDALGGRRPKRAERTA